MTAVVADGEDSDYHGMKGIYNIYNDCDPA